MPGGEKDAIPRFRTSGCGQTRTLGIGNILGNRAPHFTIFTDGDIGQTFGSAGFGPILPSVEGAARLRSTTGHHHGAHIGVLEYPKRGVFEVFTQFH